jgi:ABC-type multidrug transport system fused ATPase/permease subunit
MTNKNLFIHSFSYFYKHLGPHIFTLLFLSLMVGILDGLGLTMFLPLLQIGSNDGNTGYHAFKDLGFIVNLFSSIGVKPTLIPVLLLMVLFFLFKGIATFINEYYRVVLEQKFVRVLRHNLVHLLNRVSFGYFTNADIGMIQNTMTGEVGRVVTAYTSFFGLLQQVILVLVYIYFAFMLDPSFAVIVTLGGLLTSVVFRRLYKITQNTSAHLTKKNHSFQGLIIQHVGNFKYLKATGSLSKYGKKLDNTILSIEESNKKIGTLKAILQSAREPLLVVVVAITIVIKTSFLGANLASILVSLLFFYRSLTYLFAAQTQLNQFFGVSGSFENIKHYQEELAANKEALGEMDFSHLNHSITLENIHLAYGAQSVLRGINVVIQKNSITALVGASGSGKTSIINLVAGLIPPSTGRVMVDNIDMNLLNKDQYQNRVGYITQESVVFNDTIFNNVTFWDDKSTENLNRFHKAVGLANILDFILELPEKEDTLLGNSGINLSGGQKQRLSIARELYKEIDILIMDEATSALDSESELMIKQNIDSLKGKCTMIMVAHRLSTVKSADKIILLKNGGIGFEGTFDQLNASVPDFQRMVELQAL